MCVRVCVCVFFNVIMFLLLTVCARVFESALVCSAFWKYWSSCLPRVSVLWFGVMTVACSLAGPECRKLRLRERLVLSEWSQLNIERNAFLCYEKTHIYTKNLMLSKSVYLQLCAILISTGERSLTICIRL